MSTDDELESLFHPLDVKDNVDPHYFEKLLQQELPNIPGEWIRIVLSSHPHRLLTSKMHPPRGQAASQFMFRSWAMRTDHLDFVGRVGTVAVALSSALAANGSPVAAGASLFMFCLATIDRVARKVSSVDLLQFHVLMTLKAIGPSTLETLRLKLDELAIDEHGKWTDDQVLAELAALKDNRSRDGQLDALVNHTPPDVWSINGV